MKRAQNIWASLGITFCAVAITLSLQTAGAFHLLSLKAYDLFTVGKTVLAPEPFRGPISLIAIDDATLEVPPFTIPLSSWHTNFSVVMEGLAMGNASVIGMDFLLPEKIFDREAEEFHQFSRKWLRMLAGIREREQRVIFNYIQFQDRALVPAFPYRIAMGPENLALANLRTDSDDFVRHHKLWYEDARGNRVQTFAWAIAKRFDPDLAKARLPLGPELAISFLHPIPAFPTHPMYEVYQRAKAQDVEWLRERFDGRIVLIGATNSLDKDFVATPMNFLATTQRRNMPGVEVHAHILNTLLSRKSQSQLSTAAQGGLFAALALLTAMGVLLTSRMVMFGAMPLLLAAAVGGAFILFTRGVELPTVPMLAAMFLAGAMAILWREYGMEREKKQLRKLFQRYLPPHVVDKLAATQDAEFFKGERRELCILISDVRGFTTWSKEQEPQVVVARLNEYFDAMTQIIQQHGGVVDKFLGDGILAFFGIVDQEDSPSLSAGKAALEMLTKLDELNAHWAAEGEPVFRIGIGMHTGPVMVGNIGSRHKSEFTVIGDPVNVASRLESMTKQLGCPILVTKAFYDDVKSRMLLDDKGEVAIRGHSTMHAYALVGVSPGSEKGMEL